MTAQDIGYGAGAAFCAFMGVLQQYKFKRVRSDLASQCKEEIEAHERAINHTALKLEKLKLQFLELADAMLMPDIQGNEETRHHKVQRARDRISRLPLLTEVQYAADPDEE